MTTDTQTKFVPVARFAVEGEGDVLVPLDTDDGWDTLRSEFEGWYDESAGPDAAVGLSVGFEVWAREDIDKVPDHPGW